jgi:hypothetical protein
MENVGVVVVEREELTVVERVGATVREGLEKGENVPTGTTAPANGRATLGPGPDTLSQSAPLRQRPEHVEVVSSVVFP